jgi:histidine phosphotransferase ChpT
MSATLMLDPLDLAALLCSRVCHDLISPSGAIVNGLEVLEEASDEETRTFALELIKKSARMASARLQFCRIAFGAAGSAGAQIDLGDAESVARGFIEDEKIKLAWHLPRTLMPKNQVKLLLNMLLVATQAIPRGGMLVVEAKSAADDPAFKVAARGLNARVAEAVPGLLAGLPATGAVDAHAIQPFYTGLLARSSGLAVTIETQGDAIVVVAREAAGRDRKQSLQAANDVRESVVPSGLAAV